MVVFSDESYTIIVIVYFKTLKVCESNLNKDKNMEYQCCFNSHIEIWTNVRGIMRMLDSISN